MPYENIFRLLINKNWFWIQEKKIHFIWLLFYIQQQIPAKVDSQQFFGVQFRLRETT